MKFVFFLLFCALSPVASALDVWEFSLWGLNKKSSLIYLTPEGREDDDTFVKDSQGNFIKIKINALLDENSQVVLRDCIWDKPSTGLNAKETKG